MNVHRKGLLGGIGRYLKIRLEKRIRKKDLNDIQTRTPRESF
jgi:hypothetical protein